MPHDNEYPRAQRSRLGPESSNSGAMKGAPRTFAHELQSFGEAVALRTEDGLAVSYRELAARADAFAAKLGQKRRLLLIEAENAIEPLVAYLGALRGGHPVILAAAGSDNERVVATFKPSATFIRKGETWDLQLGCGEEAPMHPDLSVLLSTSGTTGATKLVRLSGAAVDANARSIVEYLGIGADDRAITSLPFHYSYGLSVVNSHLMAGATVLLTDRSVVDPEFWAFASVGEATSLAGVPYTYELLERAGFRDKVLPALRTLTQAGGRLAPEAVQRIAEWSATRGIRFFVMYGQTEATARMAYLPPEVAASRPEAIGVAIPGGRFELVGEDGAAIQTPGQAGELVYYGPNVMMGYATAPADLAAGQELNALRTGDLAVRGADGLYRIVGRNSRFAKIFGLRISLDEVEAEVRRLGGSGVVVSDDEAIYVAVTSTSELRDLGQQLAARYKVPESIFQLTSWDDLPRLPSGKVDYQSILGASKAAGVPSARTGGAKEPIAAAFARSFPRAAIRARDSFVSLGGDSLNYVSISMEIEEALGYLPEDWEQRTIAQLASLSPRSLPLRWWSPRTIETEVVLRMLAILAVVVNHASDYVVGGGAEVLLILAGYNLSRYQAGRLQAGDSFEFVRSFARRIILPYFGLLCFYLLAKRTLDVPSLLMLSNFFGRFGSLIEPFWFLEVLLQSFLVIAIVAQLRPVQAAIANSPWRFGLACLAVTLLVKCGAVAVFHHEHLQNRTPDAALPLLALGWCVHNATTTWRRLLMTGVFLVFAALSMVGLDGLWFQYPFPSSISHAVWLCASAAGLLWIRRVPLPAALHSVVASIAAGSFYIYLVHVIPLWLLFWKAGIKDLTINLVASVALGLMVWWLVERSEEMRTKLLPRHAQ